jgi:uncharacterized protein (TIGR00369 family)
LNEPLFGLNIPFGDLLGIEALEETPGRARTALNLKPEHLNSWAVAHGGAVMTLLDLTLGMAARSLEPGSMGAVTIELKTNFLAPARGRIFAEGRATPYGRTLTYSEGEVRDDSGKILAKANGTFKLLRNSPS